MAALVADDLALLLGRQDLDSGQAVQVLTIITAMASAYTRGVGFTNGEPNESIRAVILTASARLISNAAGLLRDETEGPSSVSYRSAFNGWTVAETYVLNRFRRLGL